ncbi:exodeoxyribonuclease V subunit beta [Chitinimonas sp. BJYL2]|uniref:exodeoxyribonuclease V subunit beta n=1 Tax=Chitinimonas sp. BJYL2 TaxID=2976696 RepID=UPI0022B4FADD|nr:exodeoxyribonuclease V subunit beta [Chitinimonas sp. BJYL2]
MSFDLLTARLNGLQLIEASAGTGKTWTIAALYLRLVLEARLTPEQILVVTFTRAATSELRGRIRARLAELADALDGRPADALCAALIADLSAEARADARQRLRAAVSGFDAAAIYTIHGFCQRALGEHALLAGLELGSELITDDADLLQSAFDQAYKQLLASADAGLLDWLVRRGETPDSWCKALSPYLGQPWLQIVAPEAGAVSAAQTGFDAAFAAAQSQWQTDALDDLRARIAAKHFNGQKVRSDWVETSLGRWQRWLAGPSTIEPPDKYDEKSLRRVGMAQLNEALKTPADLPPLWQALDTLLDARTQLLALRQAQIAALQAQVLREVGTTLAAGKQRRGVMSFNDLLLSLAAALNGEHGPALASKLGERYRAALIDEFQDTDPLQFTVFERIFVDQAAPTFLVGDPKQAIYSFRGADLYAYLDARERADARHTLGTNHRSTPELVAGVRQLFRMADAPFLLDALDYPEVGAHDDKPRLCIDARPLAGLSWQWLHEGGAAGAGHPVASSLRGLHDGEGTDTLSKEAGLHAACAHTARTIATLLTLGRAGRATLGERHVAAGDIAVLGTSHRQLNTLQQALGALGVPSVRIGQDSIFATEEAGALLQVLLAMANPVDRSVRAALATHLCGFDAATLLTLADDDSAWEPQLALFRRWQQQWQQRGPLAALESWLLDTGVAERLAGWRDGERRLANLLQLFELVEQAAREHLGASALIAWLRRALAGGHKDADAELLRLESDAARVRLVTIHASKGLQYPIVFCPFVWDGQDGDALLDAADLVNDTTLAVAHENHTAVLDFGSPQRPMRLAQARRERVSEKLRLLYVALTRAESQLCLGWGGISQAERSALGWLLGGGEQAQREPADWHAHVDALLNQHPEQMGWLDLPTPDVAADAQPAAPVITLAKLNRTLRWHWQMNSFSSLTANAHDEQPDHDRRSVVPLADIVSLPYQDIASFPAGARAGVMLHALFETWDFARDDHAALVQHSEQTLAAHGFDTGWAACVARMVQTTLAVPITPAGDRLFGVTPAQKRVELEFTFGLRPFAWSRLAALLADPAHGLPREFADAAARLDSHVGSGYLKGFIDLACELDGRYWIIDYKSNKLGYSTANYTMDAITTEMANAHYYLQALIYCVALHRYLKWRRPGYVYEQHFGGASYLFLRGLEAAMPGQGVWAYAPPLALIEALETLLDGGGAHAG